LTDLLINCSRLSRDNNLDDKIAARLARAWAPSVVWKNTVEVTNIPESECGRALVIAILLLYWQLS